MKIKIHTLSLVLLFTLTIFSCKKEKDDPADEAVNTITLKIDNGSKITYKDATGVVLANKLVIGGKNSDSDIQIIVDYDIDQGTYTSTSEVGMSYGVNSKAVFTTATNVTSISFEVSGHDTAVKHIQGHFTLNYMDNQNNNVTHTATGSFDVLYH